MATRKSKAPYGRLVASLALLAANSGQVSAATASDVAMPRTEALVAVPELIESRPGRSAAGQPAVWSISIDNDLFAPANEDRDYTGGFAVAVSGIPSERLPLPLRRLREIVDHAAGAAGTGGTDGGVVIGGLLAFTPEDIGDANPISEERPYASLAYIGASRIRFDVTQRAASQATLVVGVLGTSIAEQLQSSIHRRIGAVVPAGYRHQIADGGELTARFSFARHALLSQRSNANGRRGFDARASASGSVGYITELTAGFSARWGRIASPWWSSGFEYAGYDLATGPVIARGAASQSEFYVFAGLRLRARLYNALLQGQFRKSPVTLDFGDSRPLLGDAWLGLTRRTGRLSISYVLRVQSAEVRHGIAARSISWASISIARSISS